VTGARPRRIRDQGEAAVSSTLDGIVAAVFPGAGRGPGAVPAQRCAEALGVSGVAVSVPRPDRADDVVWRTGAASARLHDLQSAAGQGPGVDAAASGGLVLVPDLGAVPVQRWPAFTPAALELGTRAVFAAPLQIGAIRLGVLLAQRNAAGPLADTALTGLLAFAEAVTGPLLAATARETGAQPPPDQPTAYPPQVHQATGMISDQLGVPLAEALIRLRAYARSHQRALPDVAADIVARRLRFSQDVL